MAWDRRRRRGSDAGPLGFVANNRALVLCTVAALAVLVASRVNDALFDDTRIWLSDVASPVMEMFAGPASEVRRFGEGISSFFAVYEENQKLREENAKLLAAQRDLASLQRKVQRYEELLKIPSDAAVTSVAARVIADSSGPFVRTVLLNAGQVQGITKGQAVVDERGLLGRVVTTGNRSSRVLLLTDLNSRIPVMVEGANLKAILVGDNTGQPVLEYLPPGSRITIGTRVITTPDGGAFPPGVPVGVIAAGSRVPRVELFTAEGRADYVRILQYTAPVDVQELTPEATPPADPKAQPAKPKSTPASVPATPLTAPRPSAGTAVPLTVGRPG
jgi:rod shape-determining protein MreC